MKYDFAELENFLLQEISPAELASSIDNAIFNLISNHLENQGEPLYKQLQEQMHNLRRLRDICAKIKDVL